MTQGLRHRWARVRSFGFGIFLVGSAVGCHTADKAPPSTLPPLPPPKLNATQPITPAKPVGQPVQSSAAGRGTPAPAPAPFVSQTPPPYAFGGATSIQTPVTSSGPSDMTRNPAVMSLSSAPVVRPGPPTLPAEGGGSIGYPTAGLKNLLPSEQASSPIPAPIPPSPGGGAPQTGILAPPTLNSSAAGGGS